LQLDSDFHPGWPVRQGDILGFWDWAQLPPLQRFGVVITADCDLANGRSEQDLAYLRIISQIDYIDIFWARTQLAKQFKKHLEELTQKINRLRQIKQAAISLFSQDDIVDWVRRSSSDDICDDLSIVDAKERAKSKTHIEGVLKLVTVMATPLDTPCLSHLVEFLGKERSDLLKKAKSELNKTPNEIFFISCFRDSASDEGYYVLLDQIGIIRRDRVGDSMSALRSSTKLAYRFGRLSRTYKYAVAQQFAFLFQRIGLPDEHQARHGSALEKIA